MPELMQLQVDRGICISHNSNTVYTFVDSPLAITRKHSRQYDSRLCGITSDMVFRHGKYLVGRRGPVNDESRSGDTRGGWVDLH